MKEIEPFYRMATGGAAAGAGNTIVDALVKYQLLKYEIQYYVSINKWNSKKFETKKTELLNKEKEETENLFSVLTPETVNNLYEIEGDSISPLTLALKHHDYSLAEKLVCGLDADIVGLLTDKLPTNTVTRPILLLLEEYIFTTKPEYKTETGRVPSRQRQSIRSIIACGLSTDKYYGMAKDILDKVFGDEMFINKNTGENPTVDLILNIIKKIREHFGQKVGGARRRKTRRHHRNRRKSRKQR